MYDGAGAARGARCAVLPPWPPEALPGAIMRTLSCSAISPGAGAPGHYIVEVALRSRAWR